MHGAITGCEFKLRDVILAARGFDIGNLGDIFRILIIIAKACGAKFLAPFMRAFDIFHRAVFCADLIKGEPDRANLKPVNRPIGHIMMPRRFRTRAGFFNQPLVEEDIDFLRAHHLLRDLRGRRAEDKISASLIALPDKGVVEKPARIAALLGQLGMKLAGPFHTDLCRRAHFLDPIQREHLAQADNPVLFKGSDFLFSDRPQQFFHLHQDTFLGCAPCL